ncbi:arginyltransferase [Alteromonas facilis]|uniref:arginyltransferase n=1 Tax=Alteromonas facilis TaxID=2048004 RepID=UPI000C295542|nr:arginyltransferase [Alteromonas facilis]
MKFGLTQTFDCSYLPEQREQLLVYVEENEDNNAQYELLIRAGFRRSGEQIYRPHCPNCSACESLRIPVDMFKPSKSQKRILSKCKHLRFTYRREGLDEHYALYDKYISERHADGSMYPPSLSQYNNFVRCSWNNPLFFEAWDGDALIAVSVVDELNEAYSALYTYFEPTLSHLSPGKLMILKMIEHAIECNKDYVYLGYQIDACQKMQYKKEFYPHERFFANQWHRIAKKAE